MNVSVASYTGMMRIGIDRLPHDCAKHWIRERNTGDYTRLHAVSISARQLPPERPIHEFIPNRFIGMSLFEPVIVTRIYILTAPMNDGEACMSNSVFAVTLVILIGLMSGVVVGLLIGFLWKKQKPFWSDMTGAEKGINIVLVGVCSAIFIVGLVWRFLLG
jgi:hypothetical protein